MFKVFTDLLIKKIPFSVYEGALSVLCVGVVLLLIWKGRMAGRYIAGLLLADYSFLLFCSTVFFRNVLPARKFDLMPFWSYKAYLDGENFYLAENIMNVVVFVPVGILLWFALRCRCIWYAIMVGAGLSVGIEALQFLFKKGFTEVDDVMHNILGCMIGYGVIALARYGYESIRVWRVTHFSFLF